MWDYLKIYGPIALLVAAGFIFAYQFVNPAPPRQLTIATGSPEGAYHHYGERYKEILAREGIDIVLQPSAGSVENLALLGTPAEEEPRVDLAFVQSGVGNPEEEPELVSLASLYYEPLWVFARAELDIGQLAELSGLRLAIGGEGSGTRHVAREVLAANGIGTGDEAGPSLLPLGGAAAAEALIAGEVDAAFLVTSHSNETIRALIQREDLRLLSFERAEAYTRIFGHLSNIQLPQGVFDLATNLPDQNITLISPVATLVARNDLHPALVDLILSAASEIHSPSGIFEEAEQFPSRRFVDFPLSAEAERYFKSGLGFLRRFLPFWAATLVERLWVMILPILTLMIPLLRIAPPTYRWQVRRRIFRWYDDLQQIEKAIIAAVENRKIDEWRAQLAALDRLQDDVGQVTVPLSYADDLYHLRLHIDFVRRRFEEIEEEGKPSLC